MDRRWERGQVEAAINRLRAAQPAVDGVLGPDVAALAALYGSMIFFRQRVVEAAQLDPACLALLERWAAPHRDGSDSAASVVPVVQR